MEIFEAHQQIVQKRVNVQRSQSDILVFLRPLDSTVSHGHVGCQQIVPTDLIHIYHDPTHTPGPFGKAS